VIGGGDGAVVREICRHKCVETIDVCELDERVVEVSKMFLPSMACSFNDPRVKLFCRDGFDFLKCCGESSYDVIIVDSSDPVGPAEVLFRKPFYQALHRALKSDGLAATQAECQWLHGDTISKIYCFASETFNKVAYAHISIPTYPCGTIGVLCCMKGSAIDCREVNNRVSNDVISQVKYYTPNLHKAAFVLPAFMERMLSENILNVT